MLHVIVKKGEMYDTVTCYYHPDTLHPCSKRNVIIIGSENSVKLYHRQDTHTQAKCRDSHTL